MISFDISRKDGRGTRVTDTTLTWNILQVKTIVYWVTSYVCNGGIVLESTKGVDQYCGKRYSTKSGNSLEKNPVKRSLV